MNDEADLLDRVVAELRARSGPMIGQLPRIARESGIKYDTLLRIKNREGDVGYSKVRQLANYLFGRSEPTPQGR
jgi:hypothetical protein